MLATKQRSPQQPSLATQQCLIAIVPQVFFGEMLHAVGAYMLLAVASFAALGRASRVGRMGALSAMSRVQGHHFMFSYLGAHHAKLCGTLSSLLSAQGFHVWIDSYRLENACSASRAYYEAARQSAYRVLCVNEHYLQAHQFSYTAIAALEHEYRPATVVHFDVKHDKWAGSDAGKRAILGTIDSATVSASHLCEMQLSKPKVSL